VQGPSSSRSRRQALTVGVLLMVGLYRTLLPRSVDASSAPSLFVFVPTLVRGRAFAAMLNAAFLGVGVTVFGRVSDFTSAVRSQAPDALLSLPETIKTLELKPYLTGIADHESKEPYVLLTHRPKLQLRDLGTSTLGFVDIVGRHELLPLVQGLLGLSSEPRVRRVLRVADLLPLLTLDLADGVVLPERFVSELKSSTRLHLRVLRPVDARLGRTSLVFLRGSNDAILQGMTRLPGRVLKILGIDSWELSQ
jgi:hypothetical protein